MRYKLFLNLIASTYFIFILCACRESGYEKHKKRLAAEREIFFQNTSQEQQKLVENFFKGELKFGNEFKGISGGFYCLWKERDRDIFPHLAVNDLFKTNSYNITSNKDSLRYIVISESVSHHIGKYSNGGDAIQMETIISIIDLKEGLAYNVRSVMGSSPPSSIRRRRGDSSGTIGSFFGDNDIFNLLKDEIIINKK